MSKNDDFVVPEASSSDPQSSSKPAAAPDAQVFPISPDMKNARHRLGDLLSGIRNGDINSTGKDGSEDENDGESSNHASDKMKTRITRDRSNIVSFELRGKPFQVRESSQNESMYLLLRSWMVGKVNDEEIVIPEKVASISPEPTGNPRSVGGAEESLDLLATKEIRRMPDPLAGEFHVPPMVIKSSNAYQRLGENANINDLRREHLAEWKTARQKHHVYMEKREEKFTPSLKLLKTVHDLTQQTTQ